MYSLRHCLCLPGHTLEYHYGPWTLWIELEAIEHAGGRFPWRLVGAAGACPDVRAQDPIGSSERH